LIIADVVLLGARAQDEQGVGDKGGDSLGDGAGQQVDDGHQSVPLAFLFNRLVDHVSDHGVNDEHDAHGQPLVELKNASLLVRLYDCLFKPFLFMDHLHVYKLDWVLQ